MANLGQHAADVPLPIAISTPNESPRSRSGHSSHNQFQLETRTNASQDGNSTVMYAEDAPREGVPNTVAVNMMNQFNQSNLYQQIQHNEYAFSPTLQTLNVVTHDPAITSLVEETAERRHREVLGNTELEAQRLQDALLLQEREEIARTRLAVGQEAAEYMQKCNQEAEIEINRRQASAQNTVEEYKRVMDQNLRQCISNKDREIQQLRDEARVRDHQRNLQIQELQNMIQQQAAANSKLQQMLESSLRIPANVHPVQSETAATANADPLANQTAKSPPMTAPPGIAPIGLANVHGFQFDVPSSSAAGTNPVIISDPVSGTPILVSKTDQRLTAAPMNPGREFRLGESGMDLPEPTTPNKCPAPSVKHYAMFPSGGGGGGGGGGDGDGDGSNFDPDRDRDLFGYPSYPAPSPTENQVHLAEAGEADLMTRIRKTVMISLQEN